MVTNGLLANFGVKKVHWECWSECNLGCPFCYRTRSIPLDSKQAYKMMKIVAAAGIRDFVFTGGDPLIRNDLPDLANHARLLGLNVEIHTNAQRNHPRISSIITSETLFGLSVDADHAEAHDAMRLKTGNFDRVISFIEKLEIAKAPYYVRSVVTARNRDSIVGIGRLLQGRSMLRKWTIVEFTPVGDGFSNRKQYRLSRDEFSRVAAVAKKYYQSAINIDVYYNVEKIGTYFQISSDGGVYTTRKAKNAHHYPIIGNILEDDLENIVSRLDFDRRLHKKHFES